MPRLKDSCIDDVRQRVSLLDVAQSYTPMKRAGSQWRGLSPFAQEKTPSFFVHPDKNVFHDYSSGNAGDLFRFVELKENLSFTEAVETLARRYGVTLEYEDGPGTSPEKTSLRKELFELHEVAADYFADCFHAQHPEAEAIRDYWTARRGFTLEHATEFTIGYAPTSGGKLFDHLREQNFSPEALRQCGLFYIRETDTQFRRVKARFRGRLMIPIRDVQGRVCAFTARKTEATPEDDPAREAKYVNSPETPIFVKGRLLFNLDRARQHITPQSSFVMVEGQLDALRCYTEGVQTAIAPQGTAITEDQLNLLRRYTTRLEVLLDGDAAGQRAAFRLLPKALQVGMDVSFLPLPEGVDPDDLFREKGTRALDELRPQAQTAMQRAVASLMPDLKDMAPRAKAAALNEIYRILGVIDTATVRDDYLAELARLIQSNPDSLRHDAAQVWAKGQPGAFAKPTPTPEPRPPARPMPQASREGKLVSVEEETLIVGFNYSYLFGQALGYLTPEWIVEDNTAGRLLRLMLLEYEEGNWDGAEEFIDSLEDAEVRAYAAQLTAMGIKMLDMRCKVDFMQRQPDADSPHRLIWEPEDALRHFIQVLTRKFTQQETRRLDELFLNTVEKEVEKRRDVLKQKKELRQLTDPKSLEIHFAA